MKTFVALENSNCARCHNALLGALRERKTVRSVWSDLSKGCLVIEHDDDPDVLISWIRSEGRAVGVAANGERVMVSLDGHEATGCPSAPDAGTSRPDRRTVVDGLSPPVVGDPERVARSQPGNVPRAASAGWEPGAGRRGDARGGVRVLSRERPAPGLVLRGARFVARTFRAVFGLPPPPR